MKAFKVRKKSANVQYNEFKEIIKDSQDLGDTKVITPIGYVVYPKVVKKLAKKGFDVLIFKNESGVYIACEISWKNAKKNRKGKVSNIIATRPISQLIHNLDPYCDTSEVAEYEAYLESCAEDIASNNEEGRTCSESECNAPDSCSCLDEK